LGKGNHNLNRFALFVTLRRFPPGFTPDSQTPWTSSGEELDRHGVLWIANQYPCVRFDGIVDGKERMKRFRKTLEEECERINAEMRKKRS
jgi:hypothetical protein